jgi:nitrogen fixation protein NifQ
MSAAVSNISNAAMQLYSQLLQHRQHLPNEEIFASIIATWQDQGGVLPANLGLSESAFKNLITHHFPHFDFRYLKNISRTIEITRFPEIEELITLLQNHRDLKIIGSSEMVEIVAMGCLGNDHLWQDLGLWSRPQLSALMKTNFPTLAARNVKDMKWKKFLYKQLCESEGIYVCRAPSCEVCTDYTKCFSPENNFK